MLTIGSDVVDQIIDHALREHPVEACGVVVGPSGTNQPLRFIPMVNVAASETFYEFDSMDLLRLHRQLAANDEDLIVIYHSHTATEAFPSRTDIAYASEPEAHYVLVSTRDHGSLGAPPELRSFRICDGIAREEEVRIA